MKGVLKIVSGVQERKLSRTFISWPSYSSAVLRLSGIKEPGLDVIWVCIYLIGVC